MFCRKIDGILYINGDIKNEYYEILLLIEQATIFWSLIMLLLIYLENIYLGIYIVGFNLILIKISHLKTKLNQTFD